MIEIESRLARAGGVCECWVWGVTASKYWISSGGDENVLKLGHGDGCTIL